ncbi:thiamine pyrophosphate-binding protein [Herbiconiux sp. KACC 21604]|uniref:thiamine pyrophosphate-binding protein n=1 Tax=unclassified Herbiconiux TaxID=2618217 RepID=UPI001492CFCC|nr:thiamine pyrophosphate-binding protein [Herbiconiux sp. SALV-R1]QJU54739.1 thiamine pyrophosphate-binding protein [Herbiconiux sp. SALV-R1]WPO85844.1 thiamine pyrophosphate-binding protein [Herbiconiux sp. KACC 21604]
MPTVSTHVAVTLSRFVSDMFGVMGNGNAHLLDALDRLTPVVYTAVRHESGAVAAADAYHRAGGGLAAATTTYGAGFSNTLTALAEAVQARSPLVLVVGDEPTSGPRDWDVDQIALASAVGARTYTVGRTDAAATTAIAVEHALAYRLPVVLALPYDVATVEAGAVPPAPELRLPHPVPPSGPFAEAAVRDLARVLREAERPVLLAGRGAWLAGAGDALGRLAALTGALTATTALGRGVFPDARYDLGVTGGFGSEAAMELIARADVAVVFGASLNAFTMRFGELFGPGALVTQVDLAEAATHPHVGRYLRADARLVAEALVAELEAGAAAAVAGSSADTAMGMGARVSAGADADADAGISAGTRVGAGEVTTTSAGVAVGLLPPHLGRSIATAPDRRSWRESAPLDGVHDRHEGETFADDGRLDPRSAAKRLGELLPADRVVVSDGGHFMGWANMYWPVASPDRMVMVGTAYQSIGLGFPSVAGAARARPEPVVVLSTGDGGGLMALADFETAVRTASGRGIAVVWNDAAYGAEVNLYGLKGLAQHPMRIPEVDFASIGEALGAEGVVVRHLDDLDAVRVWAGRPVAERRFLVVDLRISAEVRSPHQEEIIRSTR